MKLDTDDLYDCLCAALRKPLSRCGSALIATLKDETPETIGAAVRRMTYDEATLLFNWLEDDLAVAMLGFVGSEMAEYIVNHAPPGRIADIDFVSLPGRDPRSTFPFDEGG